MTGMQQLLTGAAKIAVQVVESVAMIGGIRLGTEEPAHTVVDRLPSPHGDVEIRRYGDRLAAETTVAADEDPARNIGFRRLAGYIFGANHSSAKIAMTAPVAQQASSSQKIAMTAPVSQARRPAGGSVIRFFMPSGWTMDTLPAPDDDTVRLVQVPGETVAVLRFTGDRSPAAVEDRTRALHAALADSAYRPAGQPVAWFYDPPFTVPFRRRNEVAVPVAPAGS